MKVFEMRSFSLSFIYPFLTDKMYFRTTQQEQQQKKKYSKFKLNENKNLFIRNYVQLYQKQKLSLFSHNFMNN